MPTEVNQWPVEPNNFTVVRSSLVKRGVVEIPYRRGVYMILVRGGRRLMRRMDYPEHEVEKLAQLQGKDIAYIGSARYLEVRVRQHLYASYRCSNFLSTLLAAQFAFDLLPIGDYPYYEDYGGAIARWVWANSWVAFLEHTEERAIERALLRSTRTIFNVTCAWSWPLTRARNAMRKDHPEAEIC